MIKLKNSIRPLIIAVVGSSGTGKTTIAKELHNANKIPTLVSYTTRPMRNNEVNGVDHHFVSDSDMPSKEEMLAYTYFGGYHYWTSLSELNQMKEYPHIYVIDEKGVLDLYELQDKGIIDVIWLQVERNSITNDVDNQRKKRDDERYDYLKQLNDNGYFPDIIIKNDSSIENAVKDVEEKVKDYLDNIFHR